jgi:cobyrinic acid a,c-diamide synthase
VNASAPGLIIAAPRSGAGKTTVTLGLLAALRRRGVRVRAAKSGPDYIDPAFHAAATGMASVNLDSWAMAPALIDALVGEAASDAELLVVEASMGLFDGVAGAPGRTGSGGDLAQRLGYPVLLVLDVAGQFQTAAASARGFVGFRPGVEIGGVVLNRLASPRHRDGVVAAMAEMGLPVLGEVFRDEGVALPERHLGLVQASEQADLAARLERLADLAERSLDLDAIVALARRGKVEPAGATGTAVPPPGQRIALAEDAAFSFVYTHLREGWRRAGAEIVGFSPLADAPPPDDCDACWLPGGYPELHAPHLAAAKRFQAGLAGFAETRPVHGECGGYMVLGQGLITAEGERCAMAGLLSHVTSFQARKMNLGYRSAALLHDSPLGPRGAVIRGHEFHYSSLVETHDEPLVRLEDAAAKPLGLAGGRRGQVSGAYFHAIAVA